MLTVRMNCWEKPEDACQWLTEENAHQCGGSAKHEIQPQYLAEEPAVCDSIWHVRSIDGIRIQI